MTILRLEGVSRRFGGVVAVSDVSLSIEAGTIAGIIGPNGAGKSTLFNVVTGADRPSAGSVALDGTRIDRLGAHRIVRAGLSRTFQNIRLFSSMTVMEHLIVAQQSGGGWWTALAPAASDRARVARADWALDRFGLTRHGHVRAVTLPYGTQRRVEIARAVVARPRLLMLDEPIAGMNELETGELAASLRTLRAEGLTTVLIEHHMPFVMGLCDVVHVLDAGRLIASGPPAAIQADPAVISAYLGQPA